MPDLGYILGALAAGFGITFALRAVPFAILKPLRESAFVMRLATWMPVGILVTLSLVTLQSAATGGNGHTVAALVALAVTVAAHLASGRRTLVSVSLGTITYVGLLALV